MSPALFSSALSEIVRVAGLSFPSGMCPWPTCTRAGLLVGLYGPNLKKSSIWGPLVVLWRDHVPAFAWEGAKRKPGKGKGYWLNPIF